MKPNKTVVFELCTKLKSSYENAQGHKRNEVRSYGLPAEAVMLFEEGEDSYIRSLRYMKSHRSAFKDIQDQDIEPSKKIWRLISKPQFTDGVLSVNPTQANLLEYLRNHPLNEANQHWGLEGQKAIFRERDSVKKANEQNAKTRNMVKASRLVFDSDYLGKIVPIADYLGFDTNLDAELILWSVDNYARNNPEKFIELLDSPVMDRYSDIKQAVRQGVIRVSGQQIMWADGRQILDTPLNKEPLEHLAEVSFDNNYATVWKEITRLINKTSTPAEDANTITKGASSASAKLSEIDTEELMIELKKEKIISWEAPFFLIDGKQIKGKENLTQYVEKNKKALAARLL